MYGIMTALQTVLQLAIYLILLQVAMSWLIQFQVLNLRQPLVSRLWYWTHRALEPVYGPVRRFVPAISGVDLTPLIVIVAITILQKVIGAQTGAWPQV